MSRQLFRASPTARARTSRVPRWWVWSGRSETSDAGSTVLWVFWGALSAPFFVLLVTDSHNVVALLARWAADVHFIIDRFAKHGARHGGVHAEPACREVEFIRPDNAPLVLLARRVFQRHPRAEKHPAAIGRRARDHFEFVQPLVEEADARIYLPQPALAVNV